MDAGQRRRIEQDCRDLVVRHAHYVDRGAYAAAAALYAPDGGLVRDGKVITGAVDLIEALKPKPAALLQRHVSAGSQIDVADESNAEGVTYYIAFKHDAGDALAALPAPLDRPYSMGEWHDRFVLSAAGWRLARREAIRVFQKS